MRTASPCGFCHASPLENVIMFCNYIQRYSTRRKLKFTAKIFKNSELKFLLLSRVTLIFRTAAGNQAYVDKQ